MDHVSIMTLFIMSGPFEIIINSNLKTVYFKDKPKT